MCTRHITWCMCACVRVPVSACATACVRACVRARVCASARAVAWCCTEITRSNAALCRQPNSLCPAQTLSASALSAAQEQQRREEEKKDQLCECLSSNVHIDLREAARYSMQLQWLRLRTDAGRRTLGCFPAATGLVLLLLTVVLRTVVVVLTGHPCCHHLHRLHPCRFGSCLHP